MNFSDLAPNAPEAQRLHYVDQLVAQGLSRPRAEKLIKQLYAMIDGPWARLLTSHQLLATDSYEVFAEKSLLQIFFVAFVGQWVEERLLIGAAKQAMAFQYLAHLDAGKKESN